MGQGALVATLLLAVACGGPAEAPRDATALQVAPPSAAGTSAERDAAAPEDVTPGSGRAAGEGTPPAAPEGKKVNAYVAPRYPSPLPPPHGTTLPLVAPVGLEGAGGTVSGNAAKADVEVRGGDEAFDKGDLAAAAKRYAAAARLTPKAAAPLVGQGRVRVAKVGAPLDYGAAKGNKEITAAARDLRRATELDPGFGPGYVELGRALLLLADAEGALSALGRGVEVLAEEPEAHSAYGIALLATGHGDEALRALARAAELDPGSATRHGNLGTVLLMRGLVDEAVKEYGIQVALAPADPMAHADLGAGLLAKGDVVAGTRELTAAVKAAPGRAALHSNLGYALQLQGKRSEGIAEYREALRLDAAFAGAWINLATALAQDPATRGEARAALQRARALDPTDPRVKANLDELDALERGPAPPARP